MSTTAAGPPFSDTELRDGFAIRWDPAKGRHLVATRPLQPGSLLLQQSPYAAVLNDDATPGHCDHCFRPCARPLRCSRSRLARYCCKEHQRAAWAAGYKTECEALVRCAPRVPPPTVRLAARILWRRARALEQQPRPPLAQQQQQQQLTAGSEAPGQQPQRPPVHVHHPVPPDADHEGMWALHSHWELLDDRRKALYAQMAVVTWQYMFASPGASMPADGDADAASAPAASAASAPLPAAWPGFRSVAQLLAALASNVHSVADEELRPVGIALYPTGALANHSCRPSAVQCFTGSTLQLRALRPLAPGDEITISYLELAATRQERREALADSYFFDAAAMEPPPPPAGLAPPLRPPVEAAAAEEMEVDSGDGVGASAASASQAVAASAGSSGDGAAPGSGPSVQDEPGPGPQPRPRLAVRPPPLLSLEVAPNAQLHIYPTHSEHPPWPTDPWDAQLTAVVALAGAGEPSGDTASTGGSGAGPTALPGGLLARLLPKRPNEPDEQEEGGDGDEEGDDDEEDAAMEDQGAAGPAQRAQEGPDAGPMVGSSSQPAEAEAGPRGRGDRGAGPPGRLPRLQLPGGSAHDGSGTAGARPPRIEVLAWGPWVEELRAVAASAGGPTAAAELGAATASVVGGGPAPSSATAAAVSDLLRRCVRALQLSHSASEASRDGSHGEAVGRLLQALRLLESHPHPLTGAAQPPSPPLPPPSPPQQQHQRALALALGPHNILNMRLRAQLLKAAIDQGSNGGGGAGGGSDSGDEAWDVALRAARALEAPYRLVYPGPVWPALSLHRATLAKLEALRGTPRRALAAAARALEGLRLTHSSRGGSGGGGGGWGGDGGDAGESALEATVRVAREAEAELRTVGGAGGRDAEDGDGGEDE
ncbi:hypothetical protein GPECTOR_25g365 [Gonium pectorale]|uniref:SET domain-containing protein n=1 Tax=Gonium pectorale TaxID=33097 RepID=A0A150GG13_GONPE|nr:hypothetical protein GPECTOR_25g365 [Gonium pectorale]|eukprot:KXZ48781.1 hypothetical protein GPECTOR_25g365 [Gonium pectorale]